MLVGYVCCTKDEQGGGNTVHLSFSDWYSSSDWLWQNCNI